ncbi:Actin-related protein 2/3 complex subunit 2 [Trichoplax sp. H2]|uniref:Arp2/3 complex 34 kDa subunit n=1 Tax=Trichoplax adhaerens TaxID=10228 RepID=B3RQR0_TRIAD|nr:hypothetical protein TRIADDRAFT_50117 [Trichoplax adhaerens]EDV26743.1 hypothetical protein TRIADDRAFT_50117 [Trichoplax adhaerens]RDD36918.1 Actin-related protein 2/3 complex subunit 2 [Trichoplax sp. H2]|eukprot:XP_002110739.1 hypothetical protein TRIADDRAFT_50117 [Trichoplax adhaerens]
MILLEIENKIVETTLKSRLNSQKPDAVDQTVADYDGVVFHISNPGRDKSKIMVSISIRSYAQLQQHGVDEHLATIYGNYLTTPEEGYDVSLLFDLENLSSDKDILIRNASLLKRNCVACVFEKYFDLQKQYEDQGVQSKDFAIINYREDETLYIQAQKDRVVVIFSTLFKDENDIIIGKVFMQEFKEGRRGRQEAPQVLFSHRDPPLELRGTSARIGDNVAYISFVLFPRHTNPKNRQNTINVIHTFRNYLHYHIKCSKAYLHSRMRARTEDFLKVLNRAKPEKVSEKKTISGKTFVRR